MELLILLLLSLLGWSTLLFLLCVRICVVLAALVACHFRLGGRAGVGHGHVVLAGTRVPNGTVLRSMLRARVGIGRAASCPASFT